MSNPPIRAVRITAVKASCAVAELSPAFNSAIGSDVGVCATFKAFARLARALRCSFARIKREQSGAEMGQVR